MKIGFSVALFLSLSLPFFKKILFKIFCHNIFNFGTLRVYMSNFTIFEFSGLLCQSNKLEKSIRLITSSYFFGLSNNYYFEFDFTFVIISIFGNAVDWPIHETCSQAF